MAADPNVPTVRQLRRRWKPHKERLAAERPDSPTPIRFHRACSWLARVEQTESEDHDLDLLSLWIGFNALYGQWNADRREPRPDRECWREFVDHVLRLDASRHVTHILTEHKPLVLSLLEDEHLSGFFWREPSPRRAGQARKKRFQGQSLYAERRWTSLLDQLLERVYLMRCQLVHGAATYGGKLNRRSLRRCTLLMQRLLPALLLVWIDHGADADWGPLCYPPLIAR